MKLITATDIQLRLQKEVIRAGSQVALAREIGTTEPAISLALRCGLLSKSLLTAMGFRKVVSYERIER